MASTRRESHTSQSSQVVKNVSSMGRIIGIMSSMSIQPLEPEHEASLAEALFAVSSSRGSVSATSARSDRRSEILTLDDIRSEYPLLRQNKGDKSVGLPWRWKLLWGLPCLFNSILFVMKLVVMKKLYTDEYKANIGYMAIFVILGILIDAFTDPAMASASDNSRNRCGRRRPFLVLGAVIAVPMFTLSYKPLVPDGIPATMWYGAFHIGSKLIDTTYMIPHDAWGAELTPYYNEKSRIFLIRSVCMLIGTLIGAIMPSLFDPRKYHTVTLCLASFMLLTTLLLCCLAKERPTTALPQPDRQHWSGDAVVPSLITTWLNRPFATLSIVFTVEYIGSQLPYEVLPFVLRGVLSEECMDANTQLAIMAVSRLLPQGLSMALWLRFASKFGKFWTLFVGSISASLSSLLALALTTDTPKCIWLYYGIGMCIIQGITLGATSFVTKSMVADIADYDELLSGKRREAFYMMAAEFFPKFSQMGSASLFFFFLATLNYERPGEWICAAGVLNEAWCASQKPQFNDTLAALLKYSPNKGLCGNCASSCCRREDPAQPTSIVWLLKFAFGLVPAITMFAAALALLSFPRAARSRQAVEGVRAGVEAHRNGNSVEDPFFPGRNLGPPPELVEHAGLLLHFWPRELLAVIGHGHLTVAEWDAAIQGNLIPDYSTLTRSCLLRLCLGAITALAGCILIAYGWKDLQSDLGGSVAPIGAMFIGFAVLISWFSFVRLRAAREVANAQIGFLEICRHYNYLCRFTGYTEIKLPDSKAFEDIEPPAEEPDVVAPREFPPTEHYSL